jgi:hypothetical protein
MKQEGELEEELYSARFRDQALLHSTFSQNPRLYHELYAEPEVPEDFEIPQTQEDLQAMMRELAEVGVDLNVETDF